MDTPDSELKEDMAISTASNSVLRLAYLHDLVVSRMPKTVQYVEVPRLREIAEPIAKLVEHKPIVFTYKRDQGCVALLDAKIIE